MLKEFVSLVMVPKKIKKTIKKTISVIIATVANRIKYPKRKVNLTYSNYHWLNWVEWIRTTWEKMLQPQKGTISRVQNLFFCISWQPSKFLLLKLKTV